MSGDLDGVYNTLLMCRNSLPLWKFVACHVEVEKSWNLSEGFWIDERYRIEFETERLQIREVQCTDRHLRDIVESKIEVDERQSLSRQCCCWNGRETVRLQ